MKSGDMSALRNANIASVADLLTASSDSFTVSKLAQLTGLSRPTVDTCLQFLADRNFLVKKRIETGPLGGRPAAVYSLNNEFGFFAGILLGLDEVSVTLANAGGQTLTAQGAPVRLGDNRVDLAFAILKQGIQLLNLDVADLICVTVGLIGQVSPLGRQLHRDLFPETAADSFFSDFCARFNCPVVFLNDADLAAIADYHDLARHSVFPQVLLDLSVGSALGAGLVLEGRLFSGANLGAGEMGLCKRFGWPQSFVDFEGKRAALKHSVLGLYLAAQQGETAAVRAVEELLSGGMAGIEALICAFDPDHLVISGPAALLGQQVIDRLRQHLYHLPALPEISLSPFATRAAQAGAIQTCVNMARSNHFWLLT